MSEPPQWEDESVTGRVFETRNDADVLAVVGYGQLELPVAVWVAGNERRFDTSTLLSRYSIED